MIYLDNAATSYPKPREMKEAFATFYDTPVGSYGRSGDQHTLDMCLLVEKLRDRLAEMIGAPERGEQVVFTANATQGINMVLQGMPLRREQVLMSPMEHNAVTRPVHALPGDQPSVMPALEDGKVDLYQLHQKLRSGELDHIHLCILNTMSNVNGVTQPLSEIVDLLRHYLPQVQILLDGAQGLPYVHILAEEWGIDYVAITGHKGLMGPTGTGALYIRHPLSLKPLLRGGNGHQSEVQDDTIFMPDRFEVGTLNLPGLVAWYAAVKELPPPKIDHERFASFIDRLRQLPGLHLFTAKEMADQGPLFSVQSDRYSSNELSDILRERYIIATRSGIHCAPLAHRTLGTIKGGTVRVSLSSLTPASHLESLYTALHELHN